MTLNYHFFDVAPKVLYTRIEACKKTSNLTETVKDMIGRQHLRGRGPGEALGRGGEAGSPTAGGGQPLGRGVHAHVLQVCNHLASLGNLFSTKYNGFRMS